MTPVYATATSYMPWLLTELLNEPVETSYVALVSSVLQSIPKAIFFMCFLLSRTLLLKDIIERFYF